MIIISMKHDILLTYVMYITNKRSVKPKTFKFLDISIEAIEHFKLLGITIDNKLSFTQHVSNVRKEI